MNLGLKNFYERRLLPRLVDFACGIESCTEQRAQIVPRARGRVLEIGFGSGLSLPHYDPAAVERLWAAEPCSGMSDLARGRLTAAPFPVELLLAPAEALPLGDHVCDTAVVNFTLCTLPDLSGALGELRRVLVPGGRLLFCEHGLDPNERIQRWQRRLDPLWSRLFGGCHLTRDIPRLLEGGGFRIDDLWSGNIHDLRIASYVYRGEAVVR